MAAVSLSDSNDPEVYLNGSKTLVVSVASSAGGVIDGNKYRITLAACSEVTDLTETINLSLLSDNNTKDINISNYYQFKIRLCEAHKGNERRC